MNTDFIKGVIVPIITVIDEDEKIEEAADYTGIGRNTLRKLVEWKKLPVLKVGRKVLIKTDILEKFMEANEGRDLRDKGNVKAVTRNVAT